MGWVIRRRGGVKIGARTPAYGSRSPLFTIEYHHGGSFSLGSDVSYNNGRVSFVDYCKPDEVTISALSAMACEMGCTKIKKFWAKRCGANFKTDLIEVKTDSNALDICMFVDQNRVVEVYCDGVESGYNKQGSSISVEQNSDSDNDDWNQEEGGVGTENANNDSDLERFGGSDEELGVDDNELVDTYVEVNLGDETVGIGCEGSSKGKKIVSEKGKPKESEVVNAVDDAMNEGYMSSDGFDSACESDNEGRTQKYPVFQKSDMSNVKFHLGMTFNTSDLFMKALKAYGLQSGKSVGCTRTSKKKRWVKCSGSESCPWSMYVAQMRDQVTVQIRTFNDVHTCKRALENKNCKPSFIAEKYEEMIRLNPKWPVKAFEAYVSKDLQCKVELPRAYRAFSKAKKMIEGSSADQYKDLYAYIEEMKRSNPGSTIVLKSKEDRTKNEAVFGGLYIGWAALRKGFLEGCRPVIGVDGCHLTGPHKGVLLTAVGIDANNCMYPFAYDVVWAENYDTWRWFLRLLSKDLNIHQPEDYTLISDKQKGLIKAVEEIFAGIEHRFCVRHLYNNFKLQFKGQILKDFLWKAARSCTKVHFDMALYEMGEIDQLACEWLASKPGKNWSRSHFSTHTKCDILLNNLCESFNSCIREARGKPIITMLEGIRLYLMEMVMKKSQAMKKKETYLCPKIYDKLEGLRHRSHDWKCWFNGKDEFEVQGPCSGRFAVILGDKTCTCNRWQLNGIPCLHSIVAIHHLGKDPHDWTHECYTRKTYLKIYSNYLKPLNGKDMWPRVQGKPTLLPPPVTIVKGRPAKARRRGPGEKEEEAEKNKMKVSLSRKGMVMKCKTCGKPGHNQRSCGKEKPEKKKKKGEKVEDAFNLFDESDCEMRDEVREDVGEDVREEMREDVREEMREVVREEVREVVREEVGEDVREDVGPRNDEWYDALVDDINWESVDPALWSQTWGSSSCVSEVVSPTKRYKKKAQKPVENDSNVSGKCETPKKVIEADGTMETPKKVAKRTKQVAHKTCTPLRKSSRLQEMPKKGPVIVDSIDLTLEEEESGPSTQQSSTFVNNAHAVAAAALEKSMEKQVRPTTQHAGMMRVQEEGQKLGKGQFFKQGKLYTTIEALKASKKHEEIAKSKKH